MKGSIRVLCKSTNGKVIEEEMEIFFLACKAKNVKISRSAYWMESRCTELKATFQVPYMDLAHLQRNVMAFFCNGPYTLDCMESANGVEMVMRATISELLNENKSLFLSLYLPRVSLQMVK